jgi:glycosyltransferase involved in cell wall biosynthesis
MLWNNPATRARLGEAARRRIVETFNWRRAAEQTLAVYEEVAPARRRSFAVAE